MCMIIKSKPSKPYSIPTPSKPPKHYHWLWCMPCWKIRADCRLGQSIERTDIVLLFSNWIWVLKWSCVTKSIEWEAQIMDPYTRFPLDPLQKQTQPHHGLNDIYTYTWVKEIPSVYSYDWLILSHSKIPFFLFSNQPCTKYTTRSPNTNRFGFGISPMTLFLCGGGWGGGGALLDLLGPLIKK